MINKEQFIELIEEYQKWSTRLEEVETILNAHLFECDWITYTFKLFDEILELNFNGSGIDTINWWLYEKNGDVNMKMWWNNETKEEIPTDSIEDLWNIVKDDRK